MNEMILKAYEQVGFDAVNIAAKDLAYIADALKQTDAAHPSDTYSIFNRLVSANIASDSGDRALLQPFVVREIPVRQSQESSLTKPLRVAFLGLTGAQPAPPRGLKIIDPVEAARKSVAEAKQKSDFLVALAHVSTTEALNIARQVPDIDVIIAGNGDIITRSYDAGQTLVAFTPYETRALGELRFYRDERGRFSIKDRQIVLDDLVPDAPGAVGPINQANEAEINFRKTSKKILLDWQASTRMQRSRHSADSPQSAEHGDVYASASACSQCHTQEYVKWANTLHARATGPVVFKPAEFEPSCLNCHASGLQKGTLISENNLPQLQHVQCEACHGPAGEHIAKPAKGYGHISDMKSTCAACHTPETSPAFDLQTYWEKIKH